MIPDTWLPTWTVVTAEIVPVAVTVMVTSPRSTGAVRYFSTGSPFPERSQNQAATPPASTTTSPISHLRIDTAPRVSAHGPQHFMLPQHKSGRGLVPRAGAGFPKVP